MVATSLRDYQEKLIEKARAAMAQGCRRLLIVAPTGSGKTRLTSHMLKTASNKGVRSWFIVHRKELIEQSRAEFTSQDVLFGTIAAGYYAWPEPKVQIAGIGSLVRRLDSVEAPKMIVYDECFVAGTIVNGKPIEYIKIGEYIDAFDPTTKKMSKKKVLHIFKNRAPSVLLKIKTKTNEIICTENHPILNRAGKWTQAKHLNKGDYIYELRSLWGPKKAWGKKILPKMLQAEDGPKKPGNGTRTHENQQSNEKKRSQRSSYPKTERHWAQAKNKGGQWKTITRTSKKIIRTLRLANRICSANKYLSWLWAAKPLQNRYSLRKAQNSPRNRWFFSFIQRKKSPRQEKGKILKKARVESVEILKQGSSREFESVCPDGQVYNLEVESLHTYFANNILVHNCHHVAAASWTRIAERYPNAFHIGLTATPARLDGKGLAPYFDKIIEGPTTGSLIEQGWLSPYKLFAPPGVDLRGIRTQMGDFQKKDLTEAMDKPSITGDAVREYLRHAKGKRAIAFGVSVEHSKHIAESFQKVGIPAAHVDSKTPGWQREEFMRQFRNGGIKILSNVDLFGEGVDVPALEVAILLRPTKSLALYLQQVGRALRPSEGKKYALILDHANNSLTHGLPDDEREWSLDGIKKRSSKAPPAVKVCPECFLTIRPHFPKCPYCGFTFQIQSREVEQVDGELAEVDLQKARSLKRAEQGQAKTLADLINLGKKRGYKKPHAWANYVYKSRQRKQMKST